MEILSYPGSWTQPVIYCGKIRIQQAELFAFMLNIFLELQYEQYQANIPTKVKKF
jgi:hypothetical protein